MCGSEAVLNTSTSRLFLHTLNHILGRVYPFQDGYAEGCGLPCAIFSSGKDVPACQCDGYAFFLNRRRLLKALPVDPWDQFPLEEVVHEGIALCCCNILQELAEVPMQPWEQDL